MGMSSQKTILISVLMVAGDVEDAIGKREEEINAEVSLLNHILKTRDIVTPLNAEVGKSFDLYTEEWEFLKEYYTKYREVPPKDVFSAQFADFEFYDTNGVIEHYVEELHKWRARHVLQSIITEAASGIKDAKPYYLINQMQGALAQLGRDTRMVRDVDLVNNRDERIENLRERIEIRKSGKSLLGIPSGFPTIDENMGGWQRGDFVTLAAWTGQGKSWLAMKMAQHAWTEGYRVLYFSLEMSALQIGYRFDTILSGAYGGGLTNQSLTHATEDITYDKYKTWLGDIMHDKHPFIVVTNEDLDEVTPNTVQAKIEQWKPDLVILDYVGLFDDDSGVIGETEKLKNLSKKFKRLAIKTGVPHIAITSVTMKDDHGERLPELNELAWSKQLGYDSDLCMTMVKHGNTLEIGSKKVRRCADFHLYVKADFDKGTFKEIGKTSFLQANEERAEQEDED